jgi:hypothetical protein
LENRLADHLALVVAIHAAVGARVHELVTLLCGLVDLAGVVAVLAKGEAFLVAAGVVVVIGVIVTAREGERQQDQRQSEELEATHDAGIPWPARKFTSHVHEVQPMRIGARNQLPATVKKITRGAVNAEIVLEL